MASEHKPLVGITMGDINGVGPEIILKTLQDQRMLNYIVPVVYGSTKILSFYKKRLDLEDVNYSQVKQEHQFISKKINVVNCWEDAVEIRPGVATKEAGTCAREALKKGAEDLKSGFIDAIVTAPINKSTVQSSDFNFPGHTEYFTSISDSKNSLMFMVSDKLKIGVATGHLPISDVAENINKSVIENAIDTMITSLVDDFGIIKPRIAVMGLNPHAGEDGLLGEEEKNIIQPIVTDFKNKGHLVFGPLSADGFFGKALYRNYDGILAMYHDQGLIPFKSLAFGSGVNYTAGLSFIRTSPDHGTGYDIAGKGVASADSLRKAIMQAYDITKNRKTPIV